MGVQLNPSMKLEIPYGKDGAQTLVVPERNFVAALLPNDVYSGFQYEVDAIQQGVDAPIQSEHLEQFLEGAQNVVVIVNDGTRPTPTARVLDVLQTKMRLDSARYLIATGAHRAPTEEELTNIFGDHLPKVRPMVHCHDSRKDKMVLLGRSKNGTDMWVNDIAYQADRLIIITSVEPHYFAGYTGGRKSFLPGVASYQTIEQNHRLAMRPEARILALQGNPVHEDMMDALGVIHDKRIFSIQMVLDRHQRVFRVAAGELNSSFKLATEWANEVFSVKIASKADVVVSVAHYPMDVDLYQTQKVLDNAKLALKPGGTLIFVSKCREGIGDEVFYEQLARSKDPDQVLRNLAAEYKLGYHKAAKIAELLRWAVIFGVTSLPNEALERINIRPFETVQKALDAALLEKPDASVLVIFEASVLVPRVV
jgi:nickel-dependent lactate racemase